MRMTRHYAPEFWYWQVEGATWKWWDVTVLGTVLTMSRIRFGAPAGCIGEVTKPSRIEYGRIISKTEDEIIFEKIKKAEFERSRSPVDFTNFL